MRKILLICLLFTGMLASSCEDTCNDPCIEVKLLDVVYISERYNFNNHGEFEYLALKDFYNDYFLNNNKLLVNFASNCQHVQSNLFYNKFGEIFMCNAYSLYSISGSDTVHIGNKYSEISEGILDSVFLCYPLDTIDLNENQYFTVRVEDISSIDRGFLCIEAYESKYGWCSNEGEEFRGRGGLSGSCFEIKDGKLIY